MIRSHRHPLRETGVALALLAIYVLTLLLPMHQAAAAQRDLARLGYETTGTWSICSVISTSDDGTNAPTATKCPATGVAKKDFAGPLPEIAVVAPEAVALPVVYAPQVDAGSAPRHWHFAQSRAPPSAV